MITSFPGAIIIKKLYENDTAPGMGIRLVPKLKYEHVSLTSFSKMRVDLAAQVSFDLATMH